MLVRLLLLIALILAILWLIYWFRRTPPERVSRILRKTLLWGGGGLLVLAVLTGRLPFILAAFGATLGAVIALLARVAQLMQFFPLLQRLLRGLGLGSGAGFARTGGAGQASSLRTRFLEMRLDHATGVLDGSVLDGPFKGRQLSELALEDLLRMLEFYRDSDPRSVPVLEAYLDRERDADWRERMDACSSTGRPPANTAKLTEAEACSILGLELNADPETIRAAHRRLMQRLHPDRGGSDYLAAQINAAKRRLLGD